MRADARVLTQEEQDEAYELAIRGHGYRKIAESLGFSSDYAFYNFRATRPDFAKALMAARDAGNILIEDEIKEIPETEDDPQMARAKADILFKLLAIREPARYNPKMEINLTQTMDIGHSINRMQQALDATYRDVTPQLETQKPNDFNDLW